MTRPTLPTAIALSAAAALLLTACGGSGDSDTIDAHPSGTPSSAAATATTATPSPSPTRSGVVRPVITLPKGLIDTFEGWTTGDPKKDAVLSDGAQSALASDQGAALGKANTEAILFYNTGDALLGTAQFVARTRGRGVTFIGTVRYFNPRVVFFGDSSAGLAYCGDETKGFVKDLKTGEISGGGAVTDPQSYVSYTTRLTKDKRGVWQTTSVSSIRGGKPCVP